jgi:hypothetical protein
MSKVLVATMGTEFDAQAIEEALRLLGSGHDYLILTVLQGVVPATIGDGLGLAPVMPLSPEAWIEQDKQDHVLAEREGSIYSFSPLTRSFTRRQCVGYDHR